VSNAIKSAVLQTLAHTGSKVDNQRLNSCNGGHRRNGHNELDDPSITLPLTYARIGRHPTAMAQYGAQLQGEGIISGDELQQWQDDLLAGYEKGTWGVYTASESSMVI
jgi:2-oxoglutarate dehydrogenase complex dehydrogenase (E1) component-like enzyme